ncbi:MAG: prepilin-type N-terminal cleavage/methylation domain-containing protein [Planctomycetes bacterium]|nr:prepilin-type N-terminal cleavage/methylation domain-containing protein [Planctomycetota bacterium]
MTTRQSFQRKLLQFSLIELLVVVAILAVLASLLQPGLSKITLQAKSIQCQSNLKAIGSALDLYTEDFQRYPSNNRQIWYGHHVSWDDTLGYSGHDGRMIDNNFINSVNAPEPSKMYSCPVHEEHHTATDAYPRSYKMNCQPGSWPTYEGGISGLWDHGEAQGISINSVPQPSGLIILLEANGNLGNGYDSGTFNPDPQREIINNTPSRSHDNKFSYLFCDWHVQLYTIEETVNPSKTGWQDSGKFWTRKVGD